MGDVQSAERDVTADATTEEESAQVDDIQREQVSEYKPLQNNSQIAVLTGKTEDPIAEANVNFEDEVVAEVYDKSPAIVTPKEESPEIEKTLKDDETLLEKLEINMKESPDADEPEATNVTETEANLNEINEGFKTFFNNIGLKLTIRRNSDAKPETSDVTSDTPVDTMEGEPSSPDNAKETTDDTTSENVEHSADLNTAQETLDNDLTTCPTMTDITSEDIQEKAEENKSEATGVTEQVRLDKVAEGEQGSSPISEAETTLGKDTAPEKEGATVQFNPDAEVIYLVKKFFTTGIFSGLRKKKKKRSRIGHSKDETIDKELVDMAKHEDDKIEHDQEETRQVSQNVPTAADCMEQKENASSAYTPQITVNEQELLSSQEKVQGSPLKKLLSGSSFKKHSKNRTDRKSSDSNLSDSGEHIVVNVSEQLLSSTESIENQRRYSPSESPQELTQEEEGAWASFKKLVTPKKLMKKASLTNEEAIIAGTLEEPKLTEEEQTPDASTEETKRRKDSTVSWEALLCRSGRRRSRKTSDSSDDSPKNEGDVYRPDRESRHAAESPLESSHEGDEHLAEEPSEVDGGSTWKSFKRLVTPKRRAKEEEESRDQVISDSEVNKDNSSFSKKKFLPGLKQRKSSEKQDQVSSDEADRGVESDDEDSETPAVVPLSEFDETVDQIQTQVVTESPITAEDHKPQQDLSGQITEPDLPSNSQAELKRVQESDVLKNGASNIPASNYVVEDPTEFLSKHQQLSDIPEEGIIDESMATPASANEAAIRDDTIAEDLIELTSEAVTAPEPVDITLADETEMVSAVSQLTESSKTSGNTTPVPAEYEVRQIDECLHKVVETISVTLDAATVEKINTSASPQILVTSTKNEQTILEIHKNSEATAICIDLSAEEFYGIDKIAVTPKTECLSENTETISEDTTEFDTAGISVQEGYQADVSPVEECIAEHQHLEANVREVIKASTEVDTIEVEAMTVKSDEGSVEAFVQRVITEDILAIEIDNAIGSVTEEPTQESHQTEASVMEEKEDEPLDVKSDAVDSLMTPGLVCSVTGVISKMEVQPCASVRTVRENAEDRIAQELDQQVTCEHTPDANMAAHVASVHSESNVEVLEEQIICENIPVPDTIIVIPSVMDDVQKESVTLTEQALVEKEDFTIENKIPQHIVAVDKVTNELQELTIVRTAPETSEPSSALVTEKQSIAESIPVPDEENSTASVTDEVTNETVILTEQTALEKELTTIENDPSDVPQHTAAMKGGQIPEVTEALPALTAVNLASMTYKEGEAQMFKEHLTAEDIPVEKEAFILTEKAVVEKEHIKEIDPQNVPLNVVVEEEGKVSEVSDELQELVDAYEASVYSGSNVEEQMICRDIPVPDIENVVHSVMDDVEKEFVTLTEQALVEKEYFTIENKIPQHIVAVDEVTNELQELTIVHTATETSESSSALVTEKQSISESIPVPDEENSTASVTAEVAKETVILTEQTALEKELTTIENDPSDVPQHTAAMKGGQIPEVTEALPALTAVHVASMTYKEGEAQMLIEHLTAEHIPVEKEVFILTEKAVVEKEHINEIDPKKVPINVVVEEEGKLSEVPDELQELVAAYEASVYSESNVEVLEEQIICEHIPVPDTENVATLVMEDVEKESVILAEQALMEEEETSIENDPQEVALNVLIEEDGKLSEVSDELQEIVAAYEASVYSESNVEEMIIGRDITVPDIENVVPSVMDDVEKEFVTLTEQALVEKEDFTIENKNPQHIVAVDEVTNELQELMYSESNVEVLEEQIICENIPVPDAENVAILVMDDVEKESVTFIEQALVEKEDLTIENKIPQHIVAVDEGQVTEVTNELQELTIVHTATEMSETGSALVSEKQSISESISVPDEENSTASFTAEVVKETVILTEQTALEKELTTIKNDPSDVPQHTAVMKGGPIPEVTEALSALPAVHVALMTYKQGEAQVLEEHLTSKHIPFPNTENAIGSVTNEKNILVSDTENVVTLVMDDVEKESVILSEQALVEEEDTSIENDPQEVALNVLIEEDGKLSEVSDELQELVAAYEASVYSESNVEVLEEQISCEKIPEPDTENVATFVMEDVEKESVILAEQALVEEEETSIENDPQEVALNVLIEEDGKLSEVSDELQELVAAYEASVYSESNVEEQIIGRDIPVPDFENVVPSVMDDVEKEFVTLTEQALVEKEDFTIENKIPQHIVAVDEVTNKLQELTIVQTATETSESSSTLVTEKQSISESIPVPDEENSTASVKAEVVKETVILTEQTTLEKELTTIENDPSDVPQHTAAMKGGKIPEVTEALPALTAVHVASMTYKEGEAQMLKEHLTAEDIPVEKESVILAEQALVEEEDSSIENDPQKVALNVLFEEKGKLSEVSDELQELVAAYEASVYSESNVEVLEEQTICRDIPVPDTENVVTLVMEDVEKETVILTEQTALEKELTTIENDPSDVPQHTAAMKGGQIPEVTEALPALTAVHLASMAYKEGEAQMFKEHLTAEVIPVEKEAFILTEKAVVEKEHIKDIDPQKVPLNVVLEEEGKLSEVADELQELVDAHVASVCSKSNVEVPEKQIICENIPVPDAVNVATLVMEDVEKESVTLTEQALVEKEDFTIENKIPQHIVAVDEVTNELQELTIFHTATEIIETSSALVTEKLSISESIPEISTASISAEVAKETVILTEQTAVEKELKTIENDPSDVPQHTAIIEDGQTPEVTKTLQAATAVHVASLTSEKGEAQVLEEHIPSPPTENAIASVTIEGETEAVTMTDQAVVEKEQISVENDRNDVLQHIVISEEGQIAAFHIASLMSETLENANATVADEINVKGEKELPGGKMEAVEVEHAPLINVIISNVKDVLASMPDASIVEKTDIPEPSIDVMSTEEEYKEVVESVRTLPPIVEFDMINTADKANVVVMYVPSVQLEDNHSIQVQVVDVDIKSTTATVEAATVEAATVETVKVEVSNVKEIIDICHKMDNEVENLSPNSKTDEEITEEANKVILHKVTQHEMANLPDIQELEAYLHTELSASLDESVNVKPESSEMTESAQSEVVVCKVQQVTGISLETFIETKEEDTSVELAIATEQEKGKNIPEILEDVTIQVPKEDLDGTKAELTNESNVHFLAEELVCSAKEVVMQKLVKEPILQTNSCQVITPSISGIVLPQNSGFISSVGNVESPSSLSIEFKLNIQFEQTKAPDTPPPVVEKTEPLKPTDLSEIGVQVSERLESFREPEVIQSVEYLKQKEVSEVGIQVTEKTEPVKEPESPKYLKQTEISEVGVQVTESVQLVRQTETTEIAICQTHAELSEVATQVTEITGPTTKLESTKRAVILGQPALFEVGTKPMESAQQTESYTVCIQPGTQMKITEKDMIPAEPFLNQYNQVCVEGTEVLQHVQREEEYDQEVWLDAEETVFIQEGAGKCWIETVESLESTEENHQGQTGISSQVMAQMEEAKSLEETPRIEATCGTESEGEDFSVALEHPDIKISAETSITSVE